MLGSEEGDEEPPEIKDHEGPWDEFLNRLILIAPWLAIIGTLGYLLYYGDLVGDVTVSGQVPIAPIVYVTVGLLGFTYALAIAKFYGFAPFTWLAARVRNAAKDYNPEE